MNEHRIRLTDADILLILAGLRARAAMTSGLRRHRIERLYERLAQGLVGNPKWRFNEERQTHEEELAAEDSDER